jgi:hypothetical protein
MFSKTMEMDIQILEAVKKSELQQNLRKITRNRRDYVEDKYMNIRKQ